MAKKKYYDGGMMSDGMSDNAGLPGKEVVKTYPTVGVNGIEGLNDGIKGIDRQITDDKKNKKKKEYPEKY